MKLSKISTRYLKSSFVIEFVVSLVAGLSAFFWAFLFSSETNLLDSRITFRNDINNYYLNKSYTDDRIVLVYIDESTLKDLNQENPGDITPRKYLSALVDVIQQGKPSVIAFDYFLEDRDPRKGGDDALIRSMEKAVSNGVAVLGGYSLKPILSDRIEETGNDKLITKRAYFKPVETDIFRKYSAVLTSTGFLNLWPQKYVSDNGEIIEMVRFHIPVFESSESFPFAIYREYMKKVSGTGIYPDGLLQRRYINFRDTNPENLIKTVDSKNIEMLAKYPVSLREEFLNNFKDRIVLIGNANAGNDIHPIPVNREPGVFGVLIHASVLLNLINNDFIVESSLPVKLLIHIMAFIAAFVLAMKNDLRKIVIYNLLLIAGYFILSFLLFYTRSLWIPVISVSLVTFITMLVVVIIRIAFSEKDNIDAADFLSDYIPETIITRLSTRIDESLFTPFKDRVFVIAGWAKNLPYSDNYKISDIRQFIDDYNRTIKEIIFEHEGCFNVFPQNGFIGFWPLSFYAEDPFEKVVEAAESIRASIESINYRAHRKFGGSEDIYIDIVILEDNAYVGSFTSGTNKTYSIISGSISGILQIPWMFSGDEKNSIIVYENIKNRLHPEKKTIKLNTRIADREIYEIE